MAVVTWNRGPWASRDRSMPYQSITAPQGQMPTGGYQFAPGVPMPPPEGDNSGRRSGGEPRGYGDAPSISGAISAALGGGLLGSTAGRVGSGVLGMGAGAVAPGLGTALTGYGLLSMIGNAIRSWSGAPAYEANPYAGLLSPAEIQATYDYEGNIRGAEAAAERAAMENSIRQAAATEPELGLSGWFGADVGQGGGNGPGSEGEAGGPAGSGSAGPGTGGTGGGANSDSDNYAKGGVSRATRGAKRATFGERGPETAIFMPDMMKRPGLQGRERQVRRGLQSAYRSLMPRGPEYPPKPGYPRGPIAPGGK